MIDPTWIHEHVIERIAGPVKFPHEPNTKGSLALANEWIAVLLPYDPEVLEAATTKFVRTWRNGWWPPIAEYMDFVREAHANRPAPLRIETAAEQRAREVERWCDQNRLRLRGCRYPEGEMLAWPPGRFPTDAEIQDWREKAAASSARMEEMLAGAVASLRMPGTKPRPREHARPSSAGVAALEANLDARSG